jgi:hypothetical protein
VLQWDTVLVGSMPKPRERQWEKVAGWWLDHLAGSSIVAIFYPLWPIFLWPLVVPSGTVLRLVVERHGVRTRSGVLRRVWIMVAVGAALYSPFAAMDGEGGGVGDFVAGYLVGLAWFVALPALMYAAVMPLATQRWFSLSRFIRRGVGRPL